MTKFIKFILCIGITAIVPMGNASINFQKKWIKIGSKNILVEIADTPEKAAQGLMFRQDLPENQGMLFIFPEEQVLSFWMKNTFVDLSIAYINKQKIIFEIRNMKAAKSELQSHFETYESKEPAQYALEMGLGWFKKNNIKVGDRLNLLIKK